MTTNHLSIFVCRPDFQKNGKCLNFLVWIFSLENKVKLIYYLTTEGIILPSSLITKLDLKFFLYASHVAHSNRIFRVKIGTTVLISSLQIQILLYSSLIITHLKLLFIPINQLLRFFYNYFLINLLVVK